MFANCVDTNSLFSPIFQQTFARININAYLKYHNFDKSKIIWSLANTFSPRSPQSIRAFCLTKTDWGCFISFLSFFYFVFFYHHSISFPPSHSQPKSRSLFAKFNLVCQSDKFGIKTRHKREKNWTTKIKPIRSSFGPIDSLLILMICVHILFNLPIRLMVHALAHSKNICRAQLTKFTFIIRLSAGETKALKTYIIDSIWLMRSFQHYCCWYCYCYYKGYCQVIAERKKNFFLAGAGPSQY